MSVGGEDGQSYEPMSNPNRVHLENNYLCRMSGTCLLSECERLWKVASTATRVLDRETPGRDGQFRVIT
jgi:hypothetical protein